MNQFVNRPTIAFTEMFNNLQGQCMKFSNQELPAGCEPACADVGFQKEVRSGRVSLLVSKGISYGGNNKELKKWFSNGILQFRTDEQLKKWIDKNLKESQDYNQGRINDDLAARYELVEEETASPVTDTEKINKELQAISNSLMIDPEDLLAELKKIVKGQDLALKSISDDVSRHLLKKYHTEPLTIFTIGGPGVGKTLTGTALHEALRNISGNEFDYSYLRLDMNQYAEQHRVSQLFGSPQGYIGFGSGAELSDQLRKNPRSIIIFDEIEKAHPDILQALMNLMNTGRLSVPVKDNRGSYSIECGQAIFYFTSNLIDRQVANEIALQRVEEDPDKIDEICRGAIVTAGWRGEIVDRMNRFVYFKPIKLDELSGIIQNEIQKMFRDYGLGITYIDPALIVDLVKKAKNNESVRRYIKILERELGGEIYRVRKHEECVSFRLVGPAPYTLVSS